MYSHTVERAMSTSMNQQQQKKGIFLVALARSNINRPNVDIGSLLQWGPKVSMHPCFKPTLNCTYLYLFISIYSLKYY